MLTFAGSVVMRSSPSFQDAGLPLMRVSPGAAGDPRLDLLRARLAALGG